MAQTPKVFQDIVLVMANKTVVCQTRFNTLPNNIWHGNPLESPSPLLLMQISIISLVSKLIDHCLKPLGQSSIVSQIFGGILFGPSVLGRSETFEKIMFPVRGSIVIETIATFGIMFFLFSIGVKMDTAALLRPGQKAMAIGLSSFIITLALSISLALFLKGYLPTDTSIAKSLPLIAASQTMNGFPVIAILLTELKILNSEIGRLALSAAMVSDVLGTCLAAVVFNIPTDVGDNKLLYSIGGITTALALVGIIVYVIRPAIIWFLKHTHEGKIVGDIYISAIFVLVLVVGLLSEIIGQHYFLGPVVLGLVVPDGPPLGSAIVSKLDTLITGLFYPTFLAISGLQTNFFKVHSQAFWSVATIALFSFLVKIASTMLPAIYHNVPIQDSFVLGLIMNTKGILPLNLYTLWKGNQMLEDEDFTLCVITVMAVTSIIAPLIKALHDPSRQYISIKRSTIEHMKRDTELRILACIHNHDNVPSIINLLDLSHATQRSPIVVVVMVLVELVGRTTPILVSNQPQKFLGNSSSTSNHIVNAFKHYEKLNEGCATVESFTAISHFDTIHDDICHVAIENSVALLIVPYHKQWAIDGTIGTVNRAIQTMNLNIIQKAPCSVGILVDKGILRGSMSVLNNQSLYSVAVIYIGGADDMESLAYGSRMARHEGVNVTVVRFLLFGSENSKDRKRDSDLIDDYRRANVGNPGFIYLEEVVRDGVGLATCVRQMTDCFELIIAGRNHEETALLTGLDEWSESEALGVVGDMLASEDLRTTASVLVVQQQKPGLNKISRGAPTVKNDKDEFAIPDIPVIQHQNHHHVADRVGHDVDSPSWAISMDKYERL